MEEIIARQNAAARPLTGKAFLLGVASIIVRLAIAQVLVNLLIRNTGFGLVNILFYAYAVALIIGFMTRTVAGNVYTLKKETLLAQKLLGDSTNTLVEIPLDAIVSIRPFAYGERLSCDYQQVTVMHPRCRCGARVQTAFYVSLVSSWLAARIAGKRAYKNAGHIVVFDEDGVRRALAFRPDGEFLAALHAVLGEVVGFDERLAGDKRRTYFLRSLNRAFPGLYPHVEDILTQEEIRQADDEIARRKEKRFAWFAGKLGKTPEQLQDVLDDGSRKCRRMKQRVKGFFAGLARLPVISQVVRAARKGFSLAAAFFAAMCEDEDEQETQQAQSTDAPRRRRGRQE